jgi:hypothetical protein
MAVSLSNLILAEKSALRVMAIGRMRIARPVAMRGERNRADPDPNGVNGSGMARVSGDSCERE